MTVPTIDPFSGVQLSALPAAHPALLEAAARSRPGGRFKGKVEPAADDATRPSAERRRAPRFRVAHAAPARPVDATGRPTGDPFSAVVADLSASGIRLLYSRFLKVDYLAVRVPIGGRPTTLVLNVTRVAPVDRHYEFSGPLVARLGNPADEKRDRPWVRSPLRQTPASEPPQPGFDVPSGDAEDEAALQAPARAIGLPMARKLPSAGRPSESLPSIGR